MEKMKQFVLQHKKLVIVLCVAFFFVVLKMAGPRTVESGNGWKHQIADFDKKCEFAVFCKSDCTTHRIHHIFGDYGYYCDDCWDLYGQKQFNSLAEKDTKSSSSDKATDAKICAQKVVKDNLKSPSTAKFCKYAEMTATNMGGDKWKITGWVDAQNSFGATVRENWTVILTLTGSGFKDASISFN